MTSSSMVRVTKYRKHTLKEHRVGDDKKDTSFEARLAGVVEGNSGQGEQRLEYRRRAGEHRGSSLSPEPRVKPNWGGSTRSSP